MSFSVRLEYAMYFQPHFFFDNVEFHVLKAL